MVGIFLASEMDYVSQVIILFENILLLILVNHLILIFEVM